MILKNLTILLTTIAVIDAQYVYTQFGENIEFFPDTPQVRTPVNLGTDFRSSKQYSVWGWIRFKGKQASITNILNVHNDRTIENTSVTIGPFPNPNFPDCPFTTDQLLDNSDLADSDLVVQNPNCSPKIVENQNVPGQSVQAKLQDLLYVNYDLNPNNTFSITFLVFNGKKTGKSPVKIEGFVDIPKNGEFWGYFAISCDYSRNVANIYFKVFDQQNNSFFKTFQLDYPQFSLNKQSTITLASVEKNNFFEAVSGFIGNIAYVEMSSFYTNQLDSLWTGYLSNSAQGYNGNLLSIDFNLYSGTNPLVNSYGLIENTYNIQGNFKPLFENDKNKLGVRFSNNSRIDLGEIDINQRDLIKSLLFWFKLSYQESLPENFVLLQRGEPGTNGYIQISLLKKENGRVVQMIINGKEDGIRNTFQFQSREPIAQDRIIYFIAGVVKSPEEATRMVYIDSIGQQDYNLISDDFGFSFDPQNITLFGNSAPQQNGFVDLLRFKIINSGSPAELLKQINLAVERDKFKFNDNCAVRSSYYRESFECYECEDKVLTNSKFCQNFCPVQFKNPLTQKCEPCLQQNCTDIDLTTFEIEQLDKEKYRFKPTRRLKNNFIDYDKINVQFVGDDFDYDVDKLVNEQEQYVDFNFKFRDSIIDENLQFKVSETQDNKYFDVNRNLLLHNSNELVREVEINTITSRICHLKDKKRDALKILAIIALVVFAISILFAIVVCIACRGRMSVGSIWKFLIHNWMRLQLIAFFLLLGFYYPCCVKEFLKWLYKFAVQWNHAFRPVIDDINEDSKDYQQGMIDSRPPEQFYERDVRAFILHNIMVLFIVQLTIFFFYLILKIWDCFVTQGANCFYTIYVFLQFSGLIGLYLIMHMQVSVFSGLNFRQAEFSHSYFVFCFLISISYLVVFLIFWMYSFFKLIGDGLIFMDQLVKNEFYYFFVGYKNDKWARTWDHWNSMAHFLIGLTIGLLYDSPLAQTIIITCILVVLLGITILLRPWKYTLLNVLEILAQLLILFAVIIFLIISAFDKQDCWSCGDREGALCWLIVIALFLAIILTSLGLLLQGLMTYLNREQYQYQGEEIIENQMMEMNNENYVENVHNVKNIQNIENIENVRNVSMNEFMNNVQVSRNNLNDIGRSPHEMAPDSVDEEFIMPKIMRALTANNSFTSDAIEESKMELDQRKKQLNKQKMNFYENQISNISEDNEPYYYDPKDRLKTSNQYSSNRMMEEKVISKRNYSRDY